MPNPTPQTLALRTLAASCLALSLACQPGPVPVGASAVPASFSLGALAEARARLSGRTVTDYSFSLVGAAGRFAEPQRHVQAFGDPATNWTGGVALTAFGCAASDIATNGVAVRAFTPSYPHRAYAITRQGRLLDLDPANPTAGYVTTPIGGTFTKTYVSLSGDGTTAFVVSDAGEVSAVNLTAVVAGAHPFQKLATGKASVGAALFVDPLQSRTNTPESTLYAVANDGTVLRATHSAMGAFAATTLGKATAITTALTGSTLVQAPCVALGGIVWVGDRRGNLNRYNTATNTLTSWIVNPGWPIETPPAVDVDDSLAVTDAFVAAGAQLYWVKPSSNAVYPGQFALAENKSANSGAITTASASSYLTLNTTTLTADSTYQAFSLYKGPVDTVQLPNQTGFLDADRVTHCEYITGQPPLIDAYVGPAGNTRTSFDAWNYTNPPTPQTGGGISPPVDDGTPALAAKLLGPTAIDVEGDGTAYADDDGSVYIGDTNHAQVLFKPGTATSGTKWASSGPLAGALDPTKVYVMAGTLNLDGVWDANDIGNGAGGTYNVRPARLGPGVPSRGTPLNLVFGVAVGNQGLYISCLNKSSLKDGGVFFIPKKGVTSAFGMSVAEGNTYVLTTQCNPQGLTIDRTTPGRDIVYISAFNWSGATNVNTLLKLDSNSGADVSVFASGLNDPVDTCLDDYGNLFIAEKGAGANRISMIWDTRNLGVANGRTWGVASPVTGSRYTIKSGLNTPQTVTFALNDPQVPSGCLYIGNTAANTILRMDEGGNTQVVAGNAGAGNTGDGGAATAAKLNFPHRAKGDGNGSIYVCDRYNNRLRVLTSPAGAGQAQGFMRFNGAALSKRALYAATLHLNSSDASGTLTAPVVGVVSPFLPNTTALWSQANVTPTNVPAFDALGLATPIGVDGAGAWTFSNNSKHDWAVPPTSLSATNPELANVFRLGMKAPVDTKNYYYPTGIGLPTGATLAPEFSTHTAGVGKRPDLILTHGTVGIGRSILSPPAIAPGPPGKRYVYLANANALFRFDATTPTAFTSGCDFTLSATGRTVAGTIYAPDGTFQPNPTPPLVTPNGRVHLLDIKASSATSYAYTLNAFDGLAGSPDMWLNTTRAIASGVTSSYADNAGIYMSSGAYVAIDEAYFGLGNGRLYRVTLN